MQTSCIFIRNLVLPARIGVHAREEEATQRVRISVTMRTSDRPGAPDTLTTTVDYERVADAIRRVVAAGHVRLVETLAERIADACLADPRVESARVRLEKLDVFADAESAGVEIERGR